MDANYNVYVNELINNNHIISHNIFNNIKCTVCFVKVSLVNKHNQCLKHFTVYQRFYSIYNDIIKPNTRSTT